MPEALATEAAQIVGSGPLLRQARALPIYILPRECTARAYGLDRRNTWKSAKPAAPPGQPRP